MNEKDLPLIGQQQQIQFPYVQVQVGMTGILLEVFSSPMTSQRIMLDEKTSNSITAEWIKNKQKIRSDLETIEAVRRSKLS